MGSSAKNGPLDHRHELRTIDDLHNRAHWIQLVQDMTSDLTAIEQLRNLCVSHSTLTSVETADSGGDWASIGGELVNTRSDFFRIGLYQSADDEFRYLITQNGGALIVLLLAERDGQRYALLQLRSEPGTIGLTSLTATIQSTPNNFRREHGGKATPFLDIVADPTGFGEIIYDGYQFDWGDFYFQKIKRFLVLDLRETMEAPPGFIWVTLNVLSGLMQHDWMVSADLRACFTHVSGPGHPALEAGLEEGFAELRPRSLPLAPGALNTDSHGVGVRFFRCRSSTREVNEWTQPLLCPSQEKSIRLVYRDEGGQRSYAVSHRTQLGLLNKRLWFPAEQVSGRVSSTEVMTSAEGGRFWRWPIRLTLCAASDSDRLDPGSDFQWMSREQLINVMSRSLQTSLELRLAWSLVRAVGEHKT